VGGARQALLSLALLTACGSAAQPVGPSALLELERLAFVPPGLCPLLPDSDLSLSRALVIDRFEFTRADLRRYWPARRARADELTWTSEAALDLPERADWPAFMDFHEAVELAALRGMRLPTPIEWLHVAVGRLGFPNPWGGSGREFFANTVVLQDGKDYSLRLPCSVGTYENGRSRTFGCYDLLGNVWEWVDGIVPGYEPPSGLGSSGESLDDGLGALTSVMGGAYNTPWRQTFEYDKARKGLRFHAQRVEKGTLSPSIGVRMCADAEPYLWAKAAEWGRESEARVREVARRWARDDSARVELKSLLARLRARAGAPAALGWLEEGLAPVQ
jgi:sulfatase-modifying factor enzyme 1